MMQDYSDDVRLEAAITCKLITEKFLPLEIELTPDNRQLLQGLRSTMVLGFTSDLI